MTFYLTIGICWGLFCLYQGCIQYHHVARALHSWTYYFWYVLGFIVNVAAWPVTMALGIYKCSIGIMDIRWTPKSEERKQFDIAQAKVMRRLQEIINSGHNNR